MKHKITLLRMKELSFFKDHLNDVMVSMSDDGDNFTECSLPVGAGFRAVAQRPRKMLSVKKWYRDVAGKLHESNTGFFFYMEEWNKFFTALPHLEQVLGLANVQRCSERGDHQNQESAASCSFCNPETFHLALGHDD